MNDIKEKIGWTLLIILLCIAIFTLVAVITASVITIKEDFLKSCVGENFEVVDDNKMSDFRIVKIKDKNTGVYYLWTYLTGRPKDGSLTVMYNKDGNVLCEE